MRMFRSVSLVIAAAVACLSCGSVWADDARVVAFGQQRPTPLSPEEAAKQFQLPPGLRIELVAAEPEVIDPVAIRFDEQGRMWVVEMSDYPHGPAEGESPQSRIRVLEDRDGNGRFETAAVFADKLLFVTGIQPWRGGAIVTLAGEVAYFQDTNGDGKADLRETWYRGFAEENSQLRANRPTLGLDNQIYIANGLRGGTVVDARRPDAPSVSISGMDFRFDPLTGDYDAATGVGQFGLTFDDVGNRFVCSNRNPLIHIVLENDVLRRGPRAAIRSASGDVAKSGFESRVYPISQAWTTSNLHAGQFTAACGVKLYRGDALPAEYYGNAFTCEPTGNLVHREVMQPAGLSFTSQPAREGVDFLASTDEWFRPVNLENGSDGALYVVDMYRAVIEHPQYMPDELKNRPDLRDGDDRGRIWRIVPKEWKRPEPAPNLGEQSSQELIARLESPNVWQRETAARLLLERQDKTSAERLTAMIASAKNHVSRIHALWMLDGLSELTPDHLRTALRDPHPRVREHAVALWDRRHRDNDELRREIVALHSDDDARLRGRVALALAPIQDRPDEIAALAEIVFRGLDDVWTRRAGAIAVGDRAAQVIESIFALPADTPLLEELAEAVGDLAAVGASQDDPEGRAATLAALLEPDDAAESRARRVVRRALLRYCQSLARGESLARLRGALETDRRERLDAIFASVEATVVDEKAADGERIDAIQLLVFAPQPSDSLARLARGGATRAIRVAAIGALARTGSDEVWQALLGRFASESPPVRSAILDGALARATRAQRLLDELEAGRIKAGELDRTHSNRLLNHGDADVRKRAHQIFAAAVPEDRQQVLADYQVALTLDADPLRGRAVFEKNCANCHRIGDVGVNVAPDISDSRTKQPAQLLVDILQPNRAIDSNYVSYVVLTEDGRTLTGIVASETATTVTLRQPEDKTITLLRSEIDEMRSTGLSLMPDGLEKNIPHADMADLISFIKNWRYLDGRTPLGGK